MGVNVASDRAYLSVVEDDLVLDIEPYSVRTPKGLVGGASLVAFRDYMCKLFSLHNIKRVRVLDPEPRYKGPYISFADRYTVESIVLLAAAEQSLDAARVSRPRVRSILDLPKKDSLQSHTSTVLEPVGKYWTDKRDVAALAALAGCRS